MKTIYIKRTDLFRDINMILCNNITEADEHFTEKNPDLYKKPCDECGGGTKENCRECDDGIIFLEPYQYYITGISKDKAEWLKEWGVKVGYSELLDLYVIPIYDFGTSWEAFSYSKTVDDDYTLDFYEKEKCETPY